MSEKKSETGSRERGAGSSNSFGTGEGQEERSETIEKVPQPAQEFFRKLRKIRHEWRREIRDHQRRKYVRRSIKAVISTALSHIDRSDTFDPIEPPEEIKTYLKEANLFTLQGVFSEVLLNLFTRFKQSEEEK